MQGSRDRGAVHSGACGTGRTRTGQGRMHALGISDAPLAHVGLDLPLSSGVGTLPRFRTRRRMRSQLTLATFGVGIYFVRKTSHPRESHADTPLDSPMGLE